MKVAATSDSRRRRGWRHCLGMTLPEMMVSLSVFTIAGLGVVYCQLFGLRMDELINSKSGAVEQARLSSTTLAAEIRGARLWQIGNGDAATFTPLALGAAQQGNALQLSLTADTNQYIVYWFDTTQGKLLRRHSGNSAAKVLAQYLTNSMYFQAQTPRGDVQYDLSYKGVIDVLMQFGQLQYPLTRIGPGYYYDHYKLELRVTPHVPDGP